VSQLPEQVWYERLPPAQQYSGVRGGMIAIGIILICIGGLCACMGAMMPMALLMQGNLAAGQKTPAIPHATQMMIGAAVVYVTIAGAIIFVAIGTLRCQRWARPVMIVISALTLISGIAGLAIFGLGYSSFAGQLNQRGGPPPGFAPIIFGGTLLVLFLFIVVVPGGFLWFFARAKVAEALMVLDPVPRWTDDVPLPVLAISLTFAIWGITTCISAIFGMAAEFGTILVGVTASAVLLIQGLIEMSIAWATFRRSAASWWAALVYAIFYAIAMGSTAVRSDKLGLYRRAGYTERQIQELGKYSALDRPMGVSAFVIFTVLAVGYLLYARRCFRPQSQTAERLAGQC